MDLSKNDNHRILLGVNIDHVATVRQARHRDSGNVAGKMIEPDLLYAALLAEQAGADGITIHPREDQRHVQRADVARIRQSIQTRLNMEMACTDLMTDFAQDIKPDSVCLVPENREEVTTEGGLDVVTHYDRVKETVDAVQQDGIKVSLFIDPDVKQIEAAIALQAEMIELHTGAFANHYYEEQVHDELKKLIEAAEMGHNNGLIVNAGHGINYINIPSILKIPHLYELNIGHSIISRALFHGLPEAVREMKARMHL